MNQIGSLYKNDGIYVIFNSIVEIESELYISCNVRIKREELFDLSVYGIEAGKKVTQHLKISDYRKMTIEEIYEACQNNTNLQHLLNYLRADKINQILN